MLPRRTTTFFGKPALALPNIFQYGEHRLHLFLIASLIIILFLVSYIKSVDGFVGCYRGLSPKILGNIVSTHFSEKIADKLGVPRVDDDEEKDDEINEEEYAKRFESQLKRSIVVHTAGAIISSPFHVVSIRMMAQFVGRETKYSSVFGSIVQIYKDEGIMGFFSGLIPRLLFDVTCVVVASTATYMVGRHFIREREGRAYFGSFSSVRSFEFQEIMRLFKNESLQFICSSIFYPLQVVSTCMVVNGSG